MAFYDVRTSCSISIFIELTLDLPSLGSTFSSAGNMCCALVCIYDGLQSRSCATCVFPGSASHVDMAVSTDSLPVT